MAETLTLIATFLGIMVSCITIYKFIEKRFLKQQPGLGQPPAPTRIPFDRSNDVRRKVPSLAPHTLSNISERRGGFFSWVRWFIGFLIVGGVLLYFTLFAGLDEGDMFESPHEAHSHVIILVIGAIVCVIVMMLYLGRARKR